MKKLPLIAGILFLAVGGFLIWKNATAPVAGPTKTTDTKDLTSATRPPQIFNSVVFDPKEVVVGDQYGMFKVTRARYNPSTASYPYATYSIDFAGTTTVRGVFGGTLGAEMGCFLSLEDVPTSTMQQLPDSSVYPHKRNGLELYVDDIPAASLPSAGDTVEVVIDHYISAYVPKDCGGDHVHVVSIKKI